jgi:hypothetical protein
MPVCDLISNVPAFSKTAPLAKLISPCVHVAVADAGLIRIRPSKLLAAVPLIRIPPLAMIRPGS